MSKNKVSNLFGQLGFFVKDFFAHWNTPPKKGYHLSNKEFICYSVGGMGVQAMGIITQYLAIVSGLYLAKAYNFDSWIVQITGWVMVLLNVARAPIIGAIIDNTNTKYGRFRPYLLWSGFACVIIFTLLAFIPGMFIEMDNFAVAKWLSVIAYQIIYFLATTIFQFFSYGRVGLAQVITPNTTERTKLYSIGGVIDSLGPSIVQFMFPLIATAITYKGMTGLITFQILTPIFGVLCAGVALIMFFGTKERLVLQKGKKMHVKFSRGVKLSFRNKYFWIVNLSNLIGFARLMLFGCANYIGIYMIGGTLGNSVVGPISTVLGLAFVPGMAFAPLIIKKIGKKKMTIISFLGSTIISGLMLIMVLVGYKSPAVPWFMYAGLFFHNMFAALWTVTGPAMTADYCDYQQWKTGDRLDGFMSNFSLMVTTAFGLLTGFFTTWLLVDIGGAADSNSYAIPEVMRNIFIIWAIGSLIGGILATIPFLFWDLTEDKHRAYMLEVKKRVLKADIEAGTLSQEDVAIALNMQLIDESGIIALGLTVDFGESNEFNPIPASDAILDAVTEGNMVGSGTQTNEVKETSDGYDDSVPTDTI